MTPDQNPRTSSQENLDFFFDIQKFNAGESEFKNKGYYRTSKPISVSIPIGKFDKSSDKPIRIDVTSFLLPNTDIHNTTWFLIPSGTKEAKKITAQLQKNEEKILLSIDQSELLNADTLTQMLSGKLEFTLVAYQSDDLSTKKPAADLEFPGEGDLKTIQQIQVIEKLSFTPGKAIDMTQVQVLVFTVKDFLSDERVSEENEMSPGMNKELKHFLHLFESGKGEKRITSQRAKRAHELASLYLKTKFINQVLDPSFIDQISSLLYGANHFLKVFKNTPGSRYHSRDINSDIYSLDNINAELSSGKYLTTHHFSWVESILFSVKSTLKDANQDIKPICLLLNRIGLHRTIFERLLGEF